MNTDITRQRWAVLLSLLSVAGLALFPGTALSSPRMQDGSPGLIDVTISLHSSPTSDTDRAPYERIIEYFADGVYEASNGAHKIRKVTVYTGGNYADRADIVWRDSGHPQAAVSGRAVEGQHVQMYDTFSGEDFLANDNGWQGGGYTLAHEWGHYYYSLYDEYQGDPSHNNRFHFPHSTDDPVPDSIMNTQWNARGGNFEWLNFSVAKNYAMSGGGTRETAQYRVYEASGWETLARPLADDPRDGQRTSLPRRILYGDLASVVPGEDEDAAIDLPSTDARSDLEIIWVSEGVTYQIVIDHSGSMSSQNKLENAKTAAKLLVDLAEIDQATIGVIKFDHNVAVVQPLTAIDSQATKDAIKAKIDTIQPGGLTAIGDAAQKALDDLLAFGTEDTNRVVYLLTNGQSNTGTNPLSVIPAYQSAQIPLFTFGYGSNANASVLQQMAQDTGGKYYFSPTTLAELTQVFQDASQLTSPSVGVATGSATVQTSTPSSFPIYVDSTLNRLDIVVTYQGSPSDVDLTLLDPVGSPSSAADCSASGTETICLFGVDALAAGSWTLQAIASSSDVPMIYRVSGSAESIITYAASVTSLTGDVVQYPEPIVLLAVLGKEWPISRAAVDATVQRPDGTTASFPLLDDGVAPDAEAGDGLYSAILDYDQNGAYNITVQFDNYAGTAQLTALSFQPSIGPDGTAMPLSDPIPITENFERFTRIQVNVANVQTDDHGNSPQDATILPADNNDVPGKIDYPDDVDVFRINVSDTDELIVRVSNLALGMDPRVRVLASDMTTVLADVDLTANTSDNGYLYLPLFVNAGDTVYVEVSHRGIAAGGLYEVSAGTRISSDKGIEEPTAVTLVSFTAQADRSRVALVWETGTEIDNAGFNLYRATAKDGPYTKINDALIAAQGDPVSGASYSFLDTGLSAGTYYYKLEDVDTSGVATRHGPVLAMVRPRLRRPAYRPTLPEF
jgi:calcium-activated chloride channel regulator 4